MGQKQSKSDEENDDSSANNKVEKCEKQLSAPHHQIEAQHKNSVISMDKTSAKIKLSRSCAEKKDYSKLTIGIDDQESNCSDRDSSIGSFQIVKSKGSKSPNNNMSDNQSSQGSQSIIYDNYFNNPQIKVDEVDDVTLEKLNGQFTETIISQMPTCCTQNQNNNLSSSCISGNSDNRTGPEQQARNSLQKQSFGKQTQPFSTQSSPHDCIPSFGSLPQNESSFDTELSSFSLQSNPLQNIKSPSSYHLQSRFTRDIVHRQNLIRKLAGEGLIANEINKSKTKNNIAQTVIVIEWDDTLFCTNFFKQNQIRAIQKLSGFAAEHLQFLTKTVKELLEATNGVFSDENSKNVFLVTGQPVSAVINDSQAFYKDVNIDEKVEIISSSITSPINSKKLTMQKESRPVSLSESQKQKQPKLFEQQLDQRMDLAKAVEKILLTKLQQSPSDSSSSSLLNLIVLSASQIVPKPSKALEQQVLDNLSNSSNQQAKKMSEAITNNHMVASWLEQRLQRNVLIKTVQLKQESTPIELAKQLKLVTDKLKDIVGSQQHMSINLAKKKNGGEKKPQLPVFDRQNQSLGIQQQYTNESVERKPMISPENKKSLIRDEYEAERNGGQSNRPTCIQPEEIKQTQ